MKKIELTGSILNITKGTKNNKPILKIGGIASTPKKDLDGDVLNPQGFDLQPLLDYGFVNWNHQAKENPNCIIGEPTVAQIVPEGLYIEAILYSDNPVAEGVYRLVETLSKTPESSRKIGFSVEGFAKQRNPQDPSEVTASVLTGVAVTPLPKNNETLVKILKGETPIAVIEEKSFANGGASEVLLEVFDEELGTTITVFKDFKINIKKSLSTTNGRSLAVESVDKKLKNTSFDPKFPLTKALDLSLRLNPKDRSTFLQFIKDKVL